MEVISKKNIKNLSLAELAEEVSNLGMEGYRAIQLRKWLYERQATSFQEMTNIKKSYIEELDQNYYIPQLELNTTQLSNDGTRKYLFKLADGKNIESVLIPSENRNTLCVSSQVGCAMDCDFCLTATMGLMRNLTVYEIVDQIGAVVRDQQKREDPKRVTNLVFMGMGEPLANAPNVYKALEILLHQDCYNFSRNHITVSTSGLAPEIEKFGDKTPVKLAISLNATTDEVRDVVMPVNKKFNIQRLLESCQKMNLPKRNSITFEYVMLHEVNDTVDDAKRLIKLLSQLKKAKINLIPFNEFPGSIYKRPPDEWIYQFQKILLDKGFVANIRKSRGRDILGACGQLATEKKAS